MECGFTIDRPDPDRAFIAEVPELPSCIADGKTYRKAQRNVERIADEWIAAAGDLGREIRKPRGQQMYAS